MLFCIVKLKKEKRNFFLQTTLLCFLDFLCCFNFCQCINSRPSKAKTLNISLESLNACLTRECFFVLFFHLTKFEKFNVSRISQRKHQLGKSQTKTNTIWYLVNHVWHVYLHMWCFFNYKTEGRSVPSWIKTILLVNPNKPFTQSLLHLKKYIDLFFLAHEQLAFWRLDSDDV